MTSAKKSTMTDDHKAAIAKGRLEARAVKAYLAALDEAKTRPPKRRSAASIKARLVAITDEMTGADPLTRLHLTQERIDLESQLDHPAPPTPDLSALEGEFVDAAAAYAPRKGIGYAAFRELGVPAAVLRRSGITRAGN
jgi:hypothetical protein